MSRRKLAVTMDQARTLLKAANAERGIIEVKIDGAVFRLIPEVLAGNDEKASRQLDPKEDWHL